jgi:hypothetical protein
VKSFNFIVDPWKISNQFSNPKDADAFLQESCDFLLALPLSTSQISNLKEILLPGGIPNYNWSDEYRAALDNGDPNHANSLATVTSKMRNLFKSIMNLSEYQLS